jgi:hypothetical protein
MCTYKAVESPSPQNWLDLLVAGTSKEGLLAGLAGPRVRGRS